MHKAGSINRNSFIILKPEAATGLREDKVPRRIYDPLADADAGAQADRCDDCGLPSCSTGKSKDAIGCPFGRDMPDIHDQLVAARDVLKQAWLLLKKRAPEVTSRIEEKLRTADAEQAPDLWRFNASFPIRVFAELKSFEPMRAAGFEILFNKHMKEAWEISRSKGYMGDVFARECPTRANLCEAGCVEEGARNSPITIPMGEGALWDYAIIKDWLKLVPKRQYNKTVVVVGSGKAGFQAACYLREEGCDVVMLDGNTEPGEAGQGQIQPYKNEVERFRIHYDMLREADVKILPNTPVGVNGLLFMALKERFNPSAIVIATGTPVPKMPDLTGNASNKVIPWTELLKAQQDVNAGRTKKLPKRLNMAGKKVIVIGTGDTAVDCNRIGAIQGASEIVFVSRRDQISPKDVAAYELMQQRLKTAGVKFSVQFWMLPQVMERHPKGGIVLKGESTSPENKGAPVELRGDALISAMGNTTGQMDEVLGISNLRVTESGSLVVEPVPTRIADKTPLMGVGAGFVGMLGDTFVLAAAQCVRGDSIAPIAGRDGWDAGHWALEAIQNPEGFREEIKAISGADPHQLVAV